MFYPLLAIQEVVYAWVLSYFLKFLCDVLKAIKSLSSSTMTTVAVIVMC